MDLGDFSREFDLLWDNVMSDAAPGLTEYEKSVFLTQAQDAYVSALYSGAAGEPFESVEANASAIVRLESQAVLEDQEEVADAAHIVAGSVFFRLPADLMYRTYESVTQTVGGSCGDVVAAVLPVTQDEFWRTWRDPFRGPSRSRALRLSHDTSGDGSASLSEIVAKHPVKSYLVRYLRHPRPIVLADLPEGLTIEGVSAATPCELDADSHRRIVSAAVSMAKAVWS